MEEKPRRILFIYTRTSTFINGDLEILSGRHIVTSLEVDNTTPLKQFFALIKEFFFLLTQINSHDVIYIWFADYHSFLPAIFARLARKKCYLVIGGYDTCRVKKYKYGSFVNPVRGFMTRISMKLATLNLCVSQYVERVVKAVAPGASTEVIYNGMRFEPATVNKPGGTPGVLCVALAASPQSFHIKGVDRFIALAAAMPHCNFTLVGADMDRIWFLTGKLPANLTILPKVEHSRLRKFYIQSNVYCQLSRRESFSLALAEAMNHGCIPVITRAGGMPEVTGGLGESVFALTGDSFKTSGENMALESAVEAVNRALSNTDRAAQAERIRTHFTFEKRAARLLELVK